MCWWCESRGITEQFFYEGAMRDVHDKCKLQMQSVLDMKAERKSNLLLPMENLGENPQPRAVDSPDRAGDRT